MGIYDREYYRREGPSFLGSLAQQGVVCNWLIGINIVCFLLQLVTRTRFPLPEGAPPEFSRLLPTLPGPFTDALILNVDKVLHGEVWRLLTYAFLHSTDHITHILFNMLFLFWFGRQVEDQLGPREFLAFYLVSAVLAGVAYVAAAEMGLHGGSALGASGAVTATLVLSACYNPRQVIYLFFLIPVPIWGFVVFMVAKDLFDTLGRTPNGVATSAHLGGAAFAFVYHRTHLRLTRWLPSSAALAKWKQERSRPRLRLYREDDESVTPVPAAARAPSAPRVDDEQLEAQMDAILAKIPRVGMEGLTESERELLLRASEAIKRRRG
jgi:membrane associated rhomboid family serine protease